jgi:hypothetical protein
MVRPGADDATLERCRRRTVKLHRRPTASLCAMALAIAGSASEAAMLAGRLAYPAETLPAVTVIARDATGENVFATHTVRGQSSYRLAVRPGAYVVFAVPDGGPDSMLRGAHTEYSVCARERARLLAGRCRTGPLVIVQIANGESKTRIDIDDWNLPEELAVTLRLPVSKGTAPAPTAALPHFEAYPAAAPAATAAARPELGSAPPAARAFRSSLEAAVDKGPFFAGTVAVARWACGTTCENWALIDKLTGTITMPDSPLQPLEHNLPCERELLEFRPDSRLLLVHRQDDGRITTHAMLWSDDVHALRALAQVVTPMAEFCARRP